MTRKVNWFPLTGLGIGRSYSWNHPIQWTKKKKKKKKTYVRWLVRIPWKWQLAWFSVNSLQSSACGQHPLQWECRYYTMSTKRGRMRFENNINQVSFNPDSLRIGRNALPTLERGLMIRQLANLQIGQILNRHAFCHGKSLLLLHGRRRGDCVGPNNKDAIQRSGFSAYLTWYFQFFCMHPGQQKYE